VPKKGLLFIQIFLDWESHHWIFLHTCNLSPSKVTLSSTEFRSPHFIYNIIILPGEYDFITWPASCSQNTWTCHQNNTLAPLFICENNWSVSNFLPGQLPPLRQISQQSRGHQYTRHQEFNFSMVWLTIPKVSFTILQPPKTPILPHWPLYKSGVSLGTMDRTFCCIKVEELGSGGSGSVAAFVEPTWISFYKMPFILKANEKQLEGSL